jgi:hypothetical protein
MSVVAWVEYRGAFAAPLSLMELRAQEQKFFASFFQKRSLASFYLLRTNNEFK